MRGPPWSQLASTGMDEMEELLTVAEIADYLKLNPQTVRNWIDAGTLPALHVGRRVRIRRSAFDALIAAGEQPPAGDELAGKPDIDDGGDSDAAALATASVINESSASARAELEQALTHAAEQLRGDDDEALIGALREVADSCAKLASALQNHPSG
jgi:excisionase family DNA binding protein